MNDNALRAVIFSLISVWIIGSMTIALILDKPIYIVPSVAIAIFMSVLGKVIGGYEQ